MEWYHPIFPDCREVTPGLLRSYEKSNPEDLRKTTSLPPDDCLLILQSMSILPDHKDVRDFISYLRLKNLSQRTITNYQTELNNFFRFCPQEVENPSKLRSTRKQRLMVWLLPRRTPKSGSHTRTIFRTANLSFGTNMSPMFWNGFRVRFLKLWMTSSCWNHPQVKEFFDCLRLKSMVSIPASQIL